MQSLRNRSIGKKCAKKQSTAAVRTAIEPLESRVLLTSVIVNSTADVLYPEGSGLISLQNACAIANASASPTTITFDPTVFASAKTIVSSSDDFTLGASQPTTTTIIGPAAGVTIDAVGAGSAIFIQDSNVTATLSNINTSRDGITNFGSLALSNATLAGSTNGSGLVNYGTATLTNVTISDNTQGYRGSGIENDGTATLTNCTISGNAAGAYGGGIDNSGTLKLTDVTISGNNSGSGQGGGIYNTGTATLTNVTLSGNTATASNFGTSVDGGGAIMNDKQGVMTLTNVTISGNTESGGAGTDAGGGGIVNNAGASSFKIANSIVAGNAADNLGPDVFGGFTSRGHNLIGKTDASSGWISSDFSGTIASPLNAKLGSLANNGGPTKTLAPLTGSPAIDHGSNSLVPSGIATDQRGLARIVNGTVDIGAVEVQTPKVQGKITVTAPAAQAATAGQSKSFALGSFAESNATGPFTVDVDWGDGTADSKFTVSAAGTIPATAHIFAGTGNKTVAVTVTDLAGDPTTKATFVATVAAASTKGSISGLVFDDTNGDGKREAPELGLGLWTVFIDASKDGKLDAGDIKTTTDINGNWSFTGLAAGTYVIRVVPVAGAASTLPTGGMLTITIAAGQNSTGHLFGEKAIA